MRTMSARAKFPAQQYCEGRDVVRSAGAEMERYPEWSTGSREEKGGSVGCS